MSAEGLQAAEEKMRAAGQPEEAIRSFARAYERVAGGESAVIRSDELEPAQDVPRLDELPEHESSGALASLAVIKLNGGLATTMGLRQPKSLVPAHGGLTFLDIIIGQTLALRRRLGVRLPLLLMNSQATLQATAAALRDHPELGGEQGGGAPPYFMQSMIPKLDAERMEPAVWPANPELEWCPPGHGDIYGALRRSGVLAQLLENGFRYAMISNSDNLGARVDSRIAAHMASEEIPFLMEVVEGGPADRKGGHIARRRRDGRLVLREIAQTPPDDEESFRDYRRWRYYNTNNVWLDLQALADVLERSDGIMELALIVNHKTVDPRDSSTPPVIQLESAMGAAIQDFPGARLLCVPRRRFIPVKTTNDLLIIRSDVYKMGEDMVAEPVSGRDDQLPLVDLDARFYGRLDRFDARFPAGPPSLRQCQRLTVKGDVTFGKDVIVRGAVELAAEEPRRIPDGSVLDGQA